MNTFIFLFVVAGLILLIFSLKNVKMRYIFLSGLCGLCSLIAVDLLTSFIETDIPLNYFTIAAGCVGGIPGTILLVVLMTFMA